MKKITMFKSPLTSVNQLVNLMDNIWSVTSEIDLCFSSYDDEENGKGWYFMNLSTKGNTTTSQSFTTDKQALKAFYMNHLKYS